MKGVQYTVKCGTETILDEVSLDEFNRWCADNDKKMKIVRREQREGAYIVRNYIYIKWVK